VSQSRKEPFFRPLIDAEIQAKLQAIKDRQRYRGSMATFVEGILERYCDGLLVEVKEGAVRAEFAGFNEKQVSHEKRSKRSAA
jgi:hypothetical protein